MKKIMIDATALSDQYKSRGIGTYARNIIEELIKKEGYEWHLIGFDDIKKDFQKKNTYFHSLGKVKFSTPKNIFFFQKKYIPIIKEVKPDLFFAPHLERGLPIGICKTSVAVHDVSPHFSGKYSQKGPITNFLKGLFYKYNLKVAKKADLILTISQFSKKELIKVGFKEEKIHVTYLGLSKNLDPEVIKRTKDNAEILKKYQISKPYILYYGGFEPNKNVDKLLEAFSIAQKSMNLKLVLLDKALYRKGEDIISESNLADEVKNLINKLKIGESVILPRFVEWKDLPIVHFEAEAFVHLSGYEGFGFSVLEALSSRVPVIAANKSCYPEIFGKAAILVDPKDVELVAKKILEVSKNSKLREKIVERGVRLAKNYNWKETGEETLKAFDKLVHKIN